MADLDDFFKKKDTRKTKLKKFTVSNPLSLNTNDSGSKVVKVKQDKPTSFESKLLSSDHDLFSNQSNDEWKDFVEEEKKDYTGLKIQNLHLNQVETEIQNSKQQESEEETEINEQGETVVIKKSGPWKKIQEQKEEEVVKAVETPVPQPKAPEPSGYVPPHLRGQSIVPKRHVNKKATLSDLSSEESYPSLGGPVSKGTKLGQAF